MAEQQAPSTTCASTPTLLPRITIRFCTQCKWMLRAAYYAQELLSTFSTSLGEVALQPSTGGTFIVDIVYTNPTMDNEVQNKTIWDRKTDGGFPETKELKRRVRDVISPERNLGHVDRDYPSSTKKPSTGAVEGGVACAPQSTSGNQTKEGCADCDTWMTEETYKDVEGGHGPSAVGSGSGAGKTQEQATGTGESGGKKKVANSNWMTEETYKDLEGGQ
ncbi:Rdx family-domain-containing protein [Sordaria brevicollis]|uniref:Rdx family-domain-containing protein n=1 Tax=Sordaria brevicollis TaxID=83679 RepID=A0AAE0NUX5_SORBR|nr:Rdx family-domain-containing protein [Sordaria brevicollis]